MYTLSPKQPNNQPLVTIVTIVLNGENFLERTINSVLSQTYENIEYIVIDGGSTDGTVDIVKRFDSQINHWISESDKGISDAMNKGIRLSSGILIQHLHAGDEFVSEETVSNIVSSYIAENWRWCMGNQLLTNLSGDVVYKFFAPKFSNWLLRIVNTIPHATVFAERSLFEELGWFDPSYKCAMDYHLWLRFSLVSRPKQFDFYVAKFLIGGKSSNIQLALGEEFRARREVLKRHVVYNVFDSLIISMRFLKHHLNIKTFAKKVDS